MGTKGWTREYRRPAYATHARTHAHKHARMHTNLVSHAYMHTLCGSEPMERLVLVASGTLVLETNTDSDRPVSRELTAGERCSFKKKTPILEEAPKVGSEGRLRR